MRRQEGLKGFKHADAALRTVEMVVFAFEENELHRLPSLRQSIMHTPGLVDENNGVLIPMHQDRKSVV